MSSETVHGIVELATTLLLVTAPLMLVRYYTTRVRQDGDPFGIGWRAIQIIVVVIAIPAIVVLAFEGIISKDVTGTLFGSVLGYSDLMTKLYITVIFGAVLIAGTIAYVGRYQIAVMGYGYAKTDSADETLSAIYRLDRWTGRVEYCQEKELRPDGTLNIECPGHVP